MPFKRSFLPSAGVGWCDAYAHIGIGTPALPRGKERLGNVTGVAQKESTSRKHIMKPFERGSPAPSRSQASSSRSSSSNHESQELSDLVMETLRRAHDDVERQVSRKLESAFASQTQLKKELSEVKSKNGELEKDLAKITCLLYTSPSPRDRTRSRMPSSA